ncbi:MAG: hypothetical protein ACUVTO_03395 [Candidatus Caldatribacteriaceae bacterium]
MNDLLASVEKAQEGLRESETRFRELFERVPVGFIGRALEER